MGRGSGGWRVGDGGCIPSSGRVLMDETAGWLLGLMDRLLMLPEVVRWRKHNCCQKLWGPVCRPCGRADKAERRWPVLSTPGAPALLGGSMWRPP